MAGAEGQTGRGGWDFPARGHGPAHRGPLPLVGTRASPRDPSPGRKLASTGPTSAALAPGGPWAPARSIVTSLRADNAAFTSTTPRTGRRPLGADRARLAEHRTKSNALCPLTVVSCANRSAVASGSVARVDADDAALTENEVPVVRRPPTGRSTSRAIRPDWARGPASPTQPTQWARSGC
jgi:hypothetical protein